MAARAHVSGALTAEVSPASKRMYCTAHQVRDESAIVSPVQMMLSAEGGNGKRGQNCANLANVCKIRKDFFLMTAWNSTMGGAHAISTQPVQALTPMS